MSGWRLRVLQLRVIVLTPAVAVLVRRVGWQRCQRLLLARPVNNHWLRDVSLAALIVQLEPTRWYRGPLRPRCLTRSLTLQAVLASCGVNTELRLGVARDSSGLAAHAWLEQAGEALNESLPPAATFTVIEGLD